MERDWAMTGRATVIMPVVKLEKKLTREGCPMVRAMRNLEGDLFSGADAG